MIIHIIGIIMIIAGLLLLAFYLALKQIEKAKKYNGDNNQINISLGEEIVLSRVETGNDIIYVKKSKYLLSEKKYELLLKKYEKLIESTYSPKHFEMFCNELYEKYPNLDIKSFLVGVHCYSDFLDNSLHDEEWEEIKKENMNKSDEIMDKLRIEYILKKYIKNDKEI